MLCFSNKITNELCVAHVLINLRYRSCQLTKMFSSNEAWFWYQNYNVQMWKIGIKEVVEENNLTFWPRPFWSNFKWQKVHFMICEEKCVKWQLWSNKKNFLPYEWALRSLEKLRDQVFHFSPMNFHGIGSLKNKKKSY